MKMLTVLKRDAGRICLKWDRFHEDIASMCDHLRQSEKLVDVTLCSESQKVKLHRLTMSACSPYLRDILMDNPCEHPVIVLTDTTAHDLHAVVEFMYKGVVYLPYIQLESFMKTLEMLQIEGIGSKEHKAPPAAVATRLSSSRPAAAEASTSEQRSPYHEPHRSSPRPTKRRRSSVQESSPVPRTASPSPPPLTISPSPPEPVSVTDSDLDDLETPDYELPAVDPLFCPESEEQLLAFKKQLGETADFVKAEDGEIKIEENVVGLDGTLSYDADFDLVYSDSQVSAGNFADAPVKSLPLGEVKQDPTYQTANEESFNDEKGNASDLVCRPVRTARICYYESSHDEDSNDETSRDGAEGRSGKDKAHESGRHQRRCSTRLGQTDTASRQTDTRHASEDAAVEDKRKQPPDSASDAAQSGSGTYHCQLSNYLCISQSHLGRHIRDSHGDIARKRRHKCEWCDYATNRSHDLKVHRRVHTGERPHSCQVAFNDSRNLMIHKHTHTGVRPYTCGVCGKGFVRSGTLVAHQRTHTGEKPYSCNMCGKAFVWSGALVAHKRTHTGEKPYTCNVCGNSFGKPDHLINHKRTHTGERPYTCDVCGKPFGNSWNLIVHKRTHTGEKPYTCDLCGKAFRCSGNLVNHKRTHTGERPYLCDLCGKGCWDSRDLFIHKLTHTGERPHTCDVCGKGFKRSKELVVHARTHTGEKPYTCDVCGKAFGCSGGLVKHKRTHTGEKPYTCEECGKTFARKERLITHKRTHTGENRTLVMCVAH